MYTLITSHISCTIRSLQNSDMVEGFGMAHLALTDTPVSGQAVGSRIGAGKFRALL